LYIGESGGPGVEEEEEDGSKELLMANNKEMKFRKRLLY